MNYEQKYKEALERAKKLHNEDCGGCVDGCKVCLENIFPELKESEDEKIRKWLIDAIESYHLVSPIGYETKMCKKALTWLEKQKPVKWSEEDERMLSNIIEDFGNGKTSNILQEYWLKILKKRMEEQQ